MNPRIFVAAITSSSVKAAATFALRKTRLGNALLVFGVAALLMGGTALVRGQSELITFDPNANVPVLAVVVQPDGKILLGGNFTTLTPNGGATVTRNHIARLNADGTVDATFNPSANLDVDAIALQPDGKIILGGFFTTLSPNGGAAVTRNRIARVNADGTLDNGFNPNASGSVRSLAVQTDGKVLAGGQFTTIGGQTRNRIARLDATSGAADLSFDPNANNTVFAVALQSDGKILLGGFFTTLSPNGGAAVTRNRMARLDPSNGVPDSFNPNATGGVFAIAVQADGQILAGGDFNGPNSIGQATRNRIARLDPTLGLADAFDPNANLGVFTIVVQADGKILAGGDFTTIGNQSRSRIARLEPTVGAADAFDPSANANASIYSIAVQTNGNVLLGGNFSSIYGQTRNHIARVGSDGSIPYLVNNTSDFVVANACTNGSAGCSLRSAIQAANASSNSVIQFAIPASDPNCAAGVCTITTAALPDISGLNNSGNTRIDGPGADKLIVRVGAGATARIFNVTSVGTTSFSGLTIRDGHLSSQSGAGIQIGANGTVNVTNCAFLNNISDSGSGGGISSSASNLTVTNCTFTGNTGFGGGMHVSGVVMNINNCVISGNSGTGGGGISFGSGTLTVTNTTLNGNSTTNNGVGGGMHIGGGTANIVNCTISGNTAQGGGGAFSNFGGNGGTLNIVNSTISGNQTTFGGGIDCRSATVNVTNSTISGNTATNNNGGGGVSNVSGTVNVKSSIIALNTAPITGLDVTGTVVSAGFNLVGKRDGSSGFTAATDQTGTVASPLDPKFDPNGLQNNGGATKTIALLSGSPAIDKATSNGITSILTTDQRGSGFARPSDDPATANASGGDGTDIGAFEVQTVVPSPTPTATPTATPTGTPTTTPTATPVTTLANISTRLRVETGDNVLIGGFIITGTQAKKVIVRGIGTSLPLADRLADPTLELHGPNGLIDSNDNWVDSPNKQAIIDSTIPPTSDKESAIVQTLPANNTGYTAIVRGVNNGTGIGVVEAFDLDTGVDSKLANISTRGFVQTGDNVLFAGTIVVGQTPQKVLIRAIGPSLQIAGKLADPTLELHDSNGTLLEENDNWVDSLNKQAIIDSTIPPNNDMESAIVRTLPANGAQYTAIVRGANNTTGIAVVEVYALN